MQPLEWGRFRWKHDVAFERYEVYVAGPGKYVLHKSYAATDICDNDICMLFEPLAMPMNGAYSWYLGATSAGNVTLWSLGTPLNMSIPWVNALGLVNVSVNDSFHPVFYWTNENLAVYYQIQIKTAAQEIVVHDKWYNLSFVECLTIICTLKLENIVLTSGSYVALVRPWTPNGLGGIHESSFTVYNPPVHLRDLAASQDFWVGAAANTSAFHNDPCHNETLAREFNVLSTENALKFEPLRPTPATWNWSDADAMVDFAEANTMRVRGHTLVWHRQISPWLNETDYTNLEIEALLEDHIRTVVGRYKGRIHTWDVVNEVLDLDGYSDSLWLRAIGPDYIEKAFQWAHESDPDALLYYNDFNLLFDNNWTDHVYNTLQDLISRGVLIHGLGMQAHVTLVTPNILSELNIMETPKTDHTNHTVYISIETPLSVDAIASNMQRFANLGLRVDITEIDVRVRDYSGSVEARLRRQADVYRTILEACQQAINCDTFITWGMSDQYTWVRSWSPDEYPLLFDDNFEPKPAYFEVRRAFVPQ